LAKKRETNGGIGRNDPCPCGSGKKYKKCCLGKTMPTHRNLSLSDSEGLKIEFANYDQQELIATLAGLQVYPENHTHAVRLELATRRACCTKNRGTKNVRPSHLQNILSSYLPANSAIAMMEDPPENLFTDNIVFHGGNYIVYPGITDGGTFILRILFQSIFHRGKGLPQRFVETVGAASLSLLILSNQVARRLGHCRYMDSPDDWPKDVHVPDAIQVTRLTNAVKFTEQEIEVLLKEMRLDSTFLTPFIIRVGDQRLLEEDPFKNPLFARPLVQIDDTIIVALPGSITSALRHFIWSLSERMGIRKVLSERFREALWIDVEEYLRLMLFKRIKRELPNWGENLPVEERLFRIDSDKFAYVQLIVDDASDYKDDEPYGSWGLHSLPEKIDARRESIARWLTKGTKASCHKVFCITVLGKIGRHIFFGLNKEPLNSRTLLIEAEELSILSQLRHCDSLTLWKYAGAREKLRGRTLQPDPMSFSSFLDCYALYLDRHHSFYLSDQAPPSWVQVLPGYGRPLRIRAARTGDVHAVLVSNPPKYVTVYRRYEDEFIPIYLPEGAVGRSFEQLVEGYAQPIWVEPEVKPEEIPDEVRMTYLEITDMFTYWLWQLTPSLRGHLRGLGSNPIHIRWRLETQSAWSDLVKFDPHRTRKPVQVRTEIQDRTIFITLPDDLIPYLHSANNEGERVLLREVMKSFSCMLVRTGASQTLNEAEIHSILNTHAPLGRKKKLLLLNTETNASLNPQNLPRFRELQDHNVEEQLDGLVEELGKIAPPIGDVLDAKQRTKLCQHIVDVYLRRLRSNLSRFHWQGLIERLIAQNEATWHHRALTWATIPTAIECFAGQQSHVERLKKESVAIGRKALTIRTLIEIVSAEPPMGLQEVSMDELDKLLAITYHLINWAMLSDDIRLGLFDHKLSILPSGRVGVGRENIEGTWDSFLSAKTLETTESVVAGFDSKFELPSEPETTDPERLKLESAFKAEFGFTMTEVIEFLATLTSFGFEQKTSAPYLNLCKLKDRLKEILHWPDSKIVNAINLFSLKPRERWEVAPNGFNAALDIWPWRYNRRLSYLRRPLIMGPQPEHDPIVFWGPRNVEQASKNLFFLVISRRYKIHEKSSDAMRTLIGEIGNKAGRQFTLEVRKWFGENTDWFVDSNVSIKPGGKLNSNIDLGDIDVLTIDNMNRKIICVECKNIHHARNSREVAIEIERIMGEDDTDDSWISKHSKRHEWLKNHLSILASVYELSTESYEIHSLVLTAEEIPTTYFRSLPLRCISFTRLKREGPRCLLSF
jgi:hypothetical protein